MFHFTRGNYVPDSCRIALVVCLEAGFPKFDFGGLRCFKRAERHSQKLWFCRSDNVSF